MQNRTLFRVMLVVGVLANIGIIILFASEKKETGLIDSWQPYTAKDAGFSLMYPTGWKMAEFNRQDIEFEVRFSSAENAYLSASASLAGALMMDILKHASVSEDPLDAYHEKYMEAMEERLGRFKRTETTKMKVSQMDAYGTSFEFRTWNGLMGRAMKGMVVSTWNGDNHLALMFVCPTPQYDKMFAAFGTFLRDFKSERIRSDDD